MKKKQILTSAYKPGLVSATLSSGGVNNKIDESLAKLFSSPKAIPPSVGMSDAEAIVGSVKENKNPSRTGKRKREKRIQNVENVEERANNSLPQNNGEFPYIHETLMKAKSQTTKQKAGTKRKSEKVKNDDDEHTGKRPRRDRQRDKKADKRTIFIGNCPLTADKKVLKRLFKEYGEIETIRFRCAPPAEPTLPRRAIVITKNFHDKCSNYVAYIVFKEEEAAKKALEKNGFILDGLHLRVDIATMSRKHDKKRSIFVGNLPFTITEETLRSHFEDCGDITNIRVIRDRSTSLGKGICYVQFKSKDSVSLALKLNKSELQGRQLRVMVCTNKPKKTEGDKVKKEKSSNKPVKQKPKKPSFAPSNVNSSSFKTILKTKKDKRFRKLKKKRENSKKTDGLSAIFGDAPAVARKVKGRKTKSNKNEKRPNKSVIRKKKMSQKGKPFRGKGKGTNKNKKF